MSEVMKLIQEADCAAIEMERARFAVEIAKATLETAKDGFEKARSFFDQTLIRADELGIPRAKIKKLIEDRTSALVASGLMASTDEKPRPPRPARVAKKTATADSESHESDQPLNQLLNSQESGFDTEHVASDVASMRGA